MDASRSVTSNQMGPHPDLITVVQKHAKTVDQTPVPPHTAEAYLTVQAWLKEADEVVLDLGCGVGVSTLNLCKMHPAARVLGVDKSAMRTAKSPTLPANGWVIRADLWAIIKLCARDNINVKKVYCLYPNPWPKKAQLKRRLHGDGRFSELVDLCKNIELRTNWRTYADEFQVAYGHITQQKAPLHKIEREALKSPITPFEAKYHASGQVLWRVTSL